MLNMWLPDNGREWFGSCGDIYPRISNGEECAAAVSVLNTLLPDGLGKLITGCANDGEAKVLHFPGWDDCTAALPALNALLTPYPDGGNYEMAKWGVGTDMPIGRWGFGMVRIPSTSSSSGGHVMVAGGYSSGGVSLDAVYMYDLDARSWSGTVAAMPVARRLFGMVHIPSVDRVSRGHVMVAGGWDGRTLDSVYMYDVDADTWSGPTTMPVTNYAFGMVHIPSVNGSGRGHVMVAGGYSNGGGYLDSVYMYDVDAEVWSSPAAAMPVARRAIGIVHILSIDGIGRGQVMVAGGWAGRSLDSVYMYDVDADTWSGPVAAMPVANHYFGMVHIPSVNGIGSGQVMLAGGYNGSKSISSVNMYDVDIDSWSSPAAVPPVARRNFGIVHIPSAVGVGRGKVMVAGGRDDGSGILDSVYFFVPGTNTTITITATTATATAATTSTATKTTRVASKVAGDGGGAEIEDPAPTTDKDTDAATEAPNATTAVSSTRSSEHPEESLMQQPESEKAPVGLIVGITVPVLIIAAAGVIGLCLRTREQRRQRAVTMPVVTPRSAHLHVNPAFSRPGAAAAESVYVEAVSTQPALYDAANALAAAASAEYAEVQDLAGVGVGGIPSISGAIYSAVVDPSTTYTPLADGKSTYAGAQFNSEA